MLTFSRSTESDSQPVRMCFPRIVQSSCFFGQQIGFFKALCFGKHLSTGSGQHDVASFFHHSASKANSVLVILDKADRAAITLMVHDAGVKTDDTEVIGYSALTHRHTCEVAFAKAGTGFDRVERSSARFEQLLYNSIRLEAMLPGGH